MKVNLFGMLLFIYKHTDVSAAILILAILDIFISYYLHVNEDSNWT
jgi:hypothetical protein